VIRGNTTGTDSLVVTAAGATSTLKINVTDLLLTINLDDQVLQARDTKSTLLHVLFTSSTGSPLANKDVKIKRSYQKDDGKDTSDFILSKTDAQGKCAITINALPYECTMGLEVTAFNSTTELASAATSISFITTRTMVINALPTVIQADGTSKSTITVQVKNESNNPMVGDDISFTTDAGLVTAKSKTDENGRAVADLQSDRRNTIATVKATLVKDPTKFVTVMVEFSGVELTASANPPSINSSGKDSTTILITLIDAAKNPIPGEPINFSKLQDSTHIYRLDTATNNRGEARCKVYGTGTGTDTIKIEAAGATTKVAFSYSSNYLKIAVDTIPIQPCFANGKDSTKIDITYNLGDQRTPVQNATLDVSVTLGSMNQDTVFTKRLTMTPANGGEISFFMKNPTFANTASIFVYAKSTSEVTSASYQLYFKAARIYHIDLSGTPEVIATNGGKAKIIAVAYDSMGNRVKDERIAFNMVSGPGGGEYIDPPTAITAEDGSAVTYLVSGKIPSLFRQVWINAGDLSAIKSDTVKFTITGPPHAITIRQNINTGHDFNDGTFGLPCAAIVTDVNGNPVADGTEVTFSSKITGWVTHRPIANFNSATTTNWCYNITIDTVLVIWPFEDLNDNYKCDPGEDINGDSVASRGEDIDGDGKFTLGPPYLDINGNGQRDYSPSQPGHYDPPEPYQMCYGYDSLGKYVARRVFADYNGNGILDTVEPLFINMTDSDYTAQLLAYKALHHNKGYDFDNNHNGIPDPQTTVSITRTVQTVGGKATNEIIYGQADATKIQVMIWAESQGIKTESPAQFVLPIIK
jgi:adhesin/invasin